MGINRWLVVVVATAAMAGAALAQAPKQLGDDGLQLLAEGYKAGDARRTARGIAMLEQAAERGNADAAFNLAAYYSGKITTGTQDDARSCRWANHAAKLNYVNAYSSVVACLYKQMTPDNRLQVFERDVLPWVRKIAAESDDAQEVAEMRNVLAEWDAAKAERRPLTLGGLMQAMAGAVPPTATGPTGATPSAAPAAASQDFVCTVYCDTSAGPTLRHTLKAASRKEAARITGAEADALCRGKGHSKASSLSLPESQCSRSR